MSIMRTVSFLRRVTRACSAEQGPHKKGPHRPENVRQQRDIYWPVRMACCDI